uniref:Fibronectin type-III domain-containing protein n=1 Tax=Leptobrachium leishanense TaxID=445787 RepID=A0A8C5QNB3_9ANUR
YITQSVASPSHENTTEILEMNNTDPSSRNLSSWTTVTSSSPKTTKITKGHQTTQDNILFITGWTGDYEEDYTKISPTVPPNVPLKPCPYDRCKHLEIPCKETQWIAQGRCLCPGVSGPSIRPNMPHLTQLIPGEKDINVSWCSPLSTVHGYRVLYGPSNGILERGPILNGSYRFYSIGGLLPNTLYLICIMAFNDVGESPVEENLELESAMSTPCRLIYTTSPKDIYIYVGVALAVLAGLVGLAVFGYWLHQKSRYSKETSLWEEMVLPNQLYKGDSVEQL